MTDWDGSIIRPRIRPRSTKKVRFPVTAGDNEELKVFRQVLIRTGKNDQG